MKFLLFPVAASRHATRFHSDVAGLRSRQARIFWLLTTGFLIACALLAPLPSSSADTALTLVQAQRKAVERSRQVSFQDLSVVAAREQAVSAGQLPDPVLKFGIDNLPVSGADQFSISRDFMTQRYVGIMQELTRSEKRQLRTQRFEREAEKSLAEKGAMIAVIQRDTALAWLDRYYAEALEGVIAQQAAEARQEIVAAEGAYRAGRGSQADVLAAHGALGGIQDQASEMGRRTQSAKLALARWIGEDAQLPLGTKPGISAIRFDPEMLSMQLDHHPEIAVYARQEEIAATEARLARADKTADWSVEVTYAQRGSSYGNMMSIGVSVPLQWDQKNRQNRDLSAKLALVDQAKARREEAVRAHTNEVRSMLAEWDSGRERLARYERELIPLAKERTRATLSAYQGGKATLTELLLARRNEIDVRMKAVTLEAEIARLWAQLDFLVPDSGSMPPAGLPAQPAANPAKGAK
jgi:outer membrane protein TolC